MKKPANKNGLRIYVSEARPPDTISLVTPIPIEGETKDQWLQRCILVHNIQPSKVDYVAEPPK